MNILSKIKDKFSLGLPKFKFKHTLFTSFLGVLYGILIVFLILNVKGLTFSILLFFCFIGFLTVLYFVEKRIYKGLGIEKYSILKFIQKKFYTFLMTIFLLPVVLTIVAYSYISLFPTSSDYVVLENKETGKEVIFRGMSHIASKNFYNTIKTEIKDKTDSGYIYYFEGVSAKNPESVDLLTKEIGIKASPEEYLKLLKFKDIEAQNQKEMNTYAFSGRIKNVDVSIEDMLKRKEELGIGENLKLKGLNVEKEMDKLKVLSSGQNTFISPIFDIYKEAFITLGNKMSGEVIKSGIAGDFFSKVILGFRNEQLAKQILENKDNKIYINYGNLHLEGVSEILQKNGFEVKETNNALKYY